MIKNYFISKDKIKVFRRGNYIGYYKNTISMDNARKKLGLKKNQFVYLFFGAIKPYKGVSELIKSFNNIKEENDVLLIAGKMHDKKINKILKNLKDPSIKIYPDCIEDDKVQTFMNSADVVVFPFKEITNSGSVLLAMSFGKPVIVSRTGCMSEIVDSSFGILYDNAKLNNLSKALKEIKKLDFKKMGENALKSVSQYDWNDWKF